jgi:apolipoprotein N-acyltransferase
VDDLSRMPSLGIPYVSGVMHSDLSSGVLSNMMLVMDRDGRVVDRYAKTILVPFGEYRPFFVSWLPTISNLKAGDGPKAIDNWAPAICYEIIFSDRLIAGSPEFILNISNDDWFGISRGPHMHLDMARAQAIETGLPVIRAGQSGISAIIDSRGRVLQSLPLGAKGIIDGRVPPAEMTVYRRIGLNGMMLLIVLLSGAILGACALFGKRADS